MSSEGFLVRNAKCFFRAQIGGQRSVGPWSVTHVNADDDKFGLERKKP